MTPSEPSRPRPMVVEARVIENRPIARATYRIRLEAPEIARAVEPGQFLMLRSVESAVSDPLLGRAFALYDVVRDPSGEPLAVDLVYAIFGRGTASLARRGPGERLRLWGPLGRGFGRPPATVGGKSVACVAGGIGQTPFLALARWWTGQAAYGLGTPFTGPFAREVSLDYGVQSADRLAGLEDFEAAGLRLAIATDDGSRGHRGFVTDLFLERLRGPIEDGPAHVLGCGPPRMLERLASMTRDAGVSCDLSLENHMACGFGVCFSCVAPIRQDDGTVDLKRVCVDGPVFPADRVAWDAV